MLQLSYGIGKPEWSPSPLHTTMCQTSHFSDARNDNLTRQFLSPVLLKQRQPVHNNQSLSENWSKLVYLSHDLSGSFGPIFDDRLKEKSLKPWKGALCIHFRVCVSARGLHSTPFNLGT